MQQRRKRYRRCTECKEERSDVERSSKRLGARLLCMACTVQAALAVSNQPDKETDVQAQEA